MRQRRNGIPFAALINREMARGQQELAQRTHALATALLERSAEVERVGTQFVAAVETLPFLQADGEQAQNLQQTVEELKTIRQELQLHLANAANGLDRQMRDKTTLRNELACLRQTLKKAPFQQGILVEAGQRTCALISQRIKPSLPPS